MLKQMVLPVEGEVTEKKTEIAEENVEEEAVSTVTPPLNLLAAGVEIEIAIASIDVRLPATIEKLMSYSWAPLDLFLHPSIDLKPGEIKFLNSKGIICGKPVIIHFISEN